MKRRAHDCPTAPNTIARLSSLCVCAAAMLCAGLPASWAGEDAVHRRQSDETPFFDMHLGLFAHYTFVGKPYQWGSTEWADGAAVESLDELADHFDVDDFAATAAAMRAQYVIFTTWHANMNVLYPSAAMERHLPGHCSRRDLIGELLRALRARDIHLILYIHPSDGHDFTPEDQERVGWNDGPPFRRWNDFINEVIAELVDRYGAGVSGYFVDGALPEQVDPARLRRTIIERQPRAWLIQNEGLNRDCVDYGAREERIQPPYPPTTWLRCQTIAGEWWAMGGYAQWAPELAYRYTVLQAAVAGRMGGGVAWSFGPHPGGRWELGVRGFCERLGTLAERASTSLFDTRPSRAFVVTDEPLFERRYVATESPDGAVTYLHVFLPPRERSLELPVPADGRRFSTARMFDSGREVSVLQTDSGVRLTLPPEDDWHDVDTILVLE